MDRSARDDPAGQGDEIESGAAGAGAGTTIDYTQSEGDPTPHARLGVALKSIGLRVIGEARLPGPVMAVVCGLLATVAVVLGLGYEGTETGDLLPFMVMAGVISVLILGATTGFAFFLIKNGAGRGRDSRGKGHGR